MSSPGPLVVGLGLLAIIMAFAVYQITTRNGISDENRKAKLEKMSNAFVGAMMCIGGSFMIVLTLLSETKEKGNVIPGLSIAVLGVIANTLFWRKYAKLNKAEPNAILAVQARLYRAKSLVDCCVTIALLSVAIAPASAVSVWLDFIGSIILHLIYR